VLASWGKAEKAIKKAKKSRDRFFMEGSFGSVIYGNRVEIGKRNTVEIG
jgi:hypothetical protein